MMRNCACIFVHSFHLGSALRPSHLVTILWPVLTPSVLCTVKAKVWLARVLLARGDVREAEDLQRQVLAARQQTHGVSHKKTVAVMRSLASVLEGSGQHEEALQLATAALANSLNAHGPGHPQTVSCRNQLATVAVSQGNLPEAETQYAQALAARQHVLGKHPDTADSFQALAAVKVQLGKQSEADELNQQALEMQCDLRGTEHDHQAAPLSSLATVFRGQEKLVQADALYRQEAANAQRARAGEVPDADVSALAGKRASWPLKKPDRAPLKLRSINRLAPLQVDRLPIEMPAPKFTFDEPIKAAATNDYMGRVPESQFV